ncbi:hypothetical protein D3C81_1642300 [compost metagenome]
MALGIPLAQFGECCWADKGIELNIDTHLLRIGLKFLGHRCNGRLESRKYGDFSGALNGLLDHGFVRFKYRNAQRALAQIDRVTECRARKQDRISTGLCGVGSEFQEPLAQCRSQFTGLGQIAGKRILQ